MRKVKAVSQIEEFSASSEQKGGVAIPKKLLAAVKNMPLAACIENPPPEIQRMVKKLEQKVGKDFISDHSKAFAPLRERFQTEKREFSIKESFEHTTRLIGAIMENNPTFSANVPIVLDRNDTKRSEVVGTGVLLNFWNRIFLLTAAHVADHCSDGELMMPGREAYIPITGKFFSTRLPASGRREKDKIDVAFCLLNNSCAADLHPSRRVLDYKNALLDEKLIGRTDYTFAGYPWRKTHAVSGSIETTFETRTRMDAKTDEYEAAGLNRKRHIAIQFHNRKTFLQRTCNVVTASLPHGISGGAIYAWTREALKEWPVQLPLAGIANTFIPEKSLLVGTRLHVYIECILHNLPWLNPYNAKFE